MDNKLKSVFVNVFQISPEQYKDALAYNEIRAWDSLGHMTLVLEIQQVFDVEFEVDEVMDMENVARIKEILRVKLGARQ